MKVIDTEAGLSKFIWDCCFKEWRDELIDFKPNYSGDILEPEFLNTKYPLVLFTGSLGLGYGLFSGIPCYNLNECCDMIIALIKDPNKKKVTLIPDFPNGCDIVDTDFDKISNTGEGSFRMRARIDIDEDNNLIIRSIPYRTTLRKIMQEQIPNLVEKSKLKYFHDMKNNSHKDLKDKEKYNIEVKIILKPGVDPEQARDLLYKSTDLETTFAVNLEMVYNYENIHYNIKGYLLDWIEFRLESKRRLCLLDLSTKSKRYYMLDTIISILSKPGNDVKLAKMSRDAYNRKDLVNNLIKTFNLSDIQADVIADFKQYQYSKESLKKFKEEADTLRVEIDLLNQKVQDDNILKEEIIAEMKECKQKYGRPRQSTVVKVKDPNIIDDTRYRISITKKGYIEKTLPDMHVGTLESGDRIADTIFINNDESLLIFDEKGKVYKLPVNEIMITPSDSVGYDITNYINITSRVVKILPLNKEPKPKESLLFVTANGMVKRTLASNYVKTTKGGIISIDLKEIDKQKDTLIDVIALDKNKDIMLYTSNGDCIRFNSKEVTNTLRMTSGVIGMKLKGDDKVKGASVIDKGQDYLVIVTSKGNGKKVSMENCPTSSRGNKGYKLITLDNDEYIAGMKPVLKDHMDVIVYLNNRYEVLPIKGIKTATKIARGVNLIKVKRGEQIIGVDISTEE